MYVGKTDFCYIRLSGGIHSDLGVGTLYLGTYLDWDLWVGVKNVAPR